jgi:hypothetical protein
VGGFGLADSLPTTKNKRLLADAKRGQPQVV